MQFVAGLSLRWRKEANEGPENGWATLFWVFERQLKKGPVGPFPFKPAGSPSSGCPHPSRRFSGVTGLDIDPLDATDLTCWGRMRHFEEEKVWLPEAHVEILLGLVIGQVFCLFVFVFLCITALPVLELAL